MLNQEELKWIASTSTELNSMLQQISRYSDLARQHKGQYSYIEMLGERVELASTTAQALFDRVTSTILEGTVAKARHAGKSSQPSFSVVHTSAAPASPKSAPATKPTAPSSSVKPASEAAAASPPEFRLLNPEGKRELILFVDDEEEITDIASQMLTREGYKVVPAKDGFEALKIYAYLGHQVGLVILDFFLPIMDGDVIFDELRALNPNVNVVLSSGFAEQSKLGAMLARGLRGFIPKPYTREKLLAQVRSTLDAGRHLMR
jgi:CheY-like chemotaxis protein